MNGCPWGGSEELWSQTAVRLRTLGHEVMASVAGWPKLSHRVTALTQRGIKLQVRQYGQSSVMGRVFKRARRMLRREASDLNWILRQKPDLVVISQGGVLDGLEWLRFCQTAHLPFVVISQCNAEAWWPTDRDAAQMSAAFQAARKLFFVAHSNLHLLERQMGESLPNAVVVRNPFNVSPDQPVAWPTETGNWRLACVARLDPVAKGHDLLFQVLARSAWRDRPVEVNLFGVGPCEQGLRRLARNLQLSQVHFHGQVEDVAEIWAQHHLLVLPSRFEGLPLALVEAMWCGRPALVTAVAGNGELCLDNETGFVAPAPTADLLADAMERAWECRLKWSQMGRAARVRVEQIIPKDPVTNFCQQLIASTPTVTTRNTH